ncbi:30S ribosomal protein S1 [Chlorella vulgaris]
MYAIIPGSRSAMHSSQRTMHAAARVPCWTSVILRHRVVVAARLRKQAQAVPCAALEAGAQVVGTVLWAGPKGAKVLLPNDVVGFMPLREAPFTIRDASEDRLASEVRETPCLPKGLVRPFRILNVPANPGGTPLGPLLSARLCDLDVLWQRASQLCDVSIQHKENLMVTIEGANNGGLLSRLNGLSLFVPVSQLEKKGHNEWWTEKDMAAQFAGREVGLAVLEVARASRKIVCSVVKARENDDLRHLAVTVEARSRQACNACCAASAFWIGADVRMLLQVGTLVSGTVRRIEPFGVFVGINGTRVSGLLHISNVSRQHIETVQGIFEVGEEVRCLVMGLDPGYTNISLSIAELEREEGDVLINKQRVWEHAEEQAALFRTWVKNQDPFYN